MKFVECMWSKTDNFTGKLGANTIKYVSKKELYHFVNFRKESKVEFASCNHEISAGQPVNNSRETCSNFNKVKFSMENHTLPTFLRIKLIEIDTDVSYSA